MATRRADDGFTLVELMVVVLVIAILLAIAIPTYLGARSRAQDRTMQANLTTAIKVESAFDADGNGFTSVVATLAAQEPNLDWTGVADESMHVVVGDVVAGDSAQVLVYAVSGSGTWFGIKLVVAGASGGRFTCEGAAETNVDDLADCTGTAW